MYLLGQFSTIEVSMNCNVFTQTSEFICCLFKSAILAIAAFKATGADDDITVLELAFGIVESWR